MECYNCGRKTDKGEYRQIGCTEQSFFCDKCLQKITFWSDKSKIKLWMKIMLYPFLFAGWIFNSLIDSIKTLVKWTEDWIKE